MDKLEFFFETSICPTLDAITDNAAQVETYLLQRMLGLGAETTFRAFPPAALMPSDPDMRNLIRFIYSWGPVFVPLDIMHLAQEWSSVLDKPLRPRDYILPQANNLPGLLFNFAWIFVLNWAIMANTISSILNLYWHWPAKGSKWEEAQQLVWEIFKFFLIFVLILFA
ncbi:hypothetical protein PG996_006930 [Apiospora saccharicola]|uniref:Uncharacterized protein n=1 Tax=Apiospora saccharicola TaxID=335842 RepID=A0ABR1VD10_9PEZI